MTEPEFNRQSDTPWLPTGPSLDEMTVAEREALQREVEKIEAEAARNEQVGH